VELKRPPPFLFFSLAHLTPAVWRIRRAQAEHDTVCIEQAILPPPPASGSEWMSSTVDTQISA